MKNREGKQHLWRLTVASIGLSTIASCGTSPPSDPEKGALGAGAAALVTPVNPQVGPSPATSQSPTQIDLMVLYTRTAEEHLRTGAAQPAPSVDLALGEIEEAVAYTNAALSGSLAHVSLELVHAACVCSDDAPELNCNDEADCSARPTLQMGSGPGEMLDLLRHPSSEDALVHEWRDAVGADLVMVVSHSGAISGIAGWPEQYGTAHDADAFGMVFPGNIMGTAEDRTFAHELGHLLGGQHDWWQEDSRLGIFAAGDSEFSPSVNELHGHVYVDETQSGGGGNNSFYTIMAYPDLCAAEGVDCRAIDRFSNPQVVDTQTGEPTGREGDTQQADYYDVCLSSDPETKKQIDDTAACPTNVVSVFNHMAPYVAAYRSTSGPSGRAEGLSAVQQGTQIQLTWQDNVSDELGFRIHRSINQGLNWYYIGAVGPNVSTYTDTIESAFEVGFSPSWRYRVQAYDESGMTTFSQAEVTIETGCDSVELDFEPATGGACPSFGELSGSWVNDEAEPWSVALNPADGGTCALASHVPPGGVSGVSSVLLNGSYQPGFVCFDVWSPGLLLQLEQVGGAAVSGSAWSYGPARVAVPLSPGTQALRWDLLFQDYQSGERVYIDNVDVPPSACSDEQCASEPPSSASGADAGTPDAGASDDSPQTSSDAGAAPPVVGVDGGSPDAQSPTSSPDEPGPSDDSEPMDDSEPAGQTDSEPPPTTDDPAAPVDPSPDTEDTALEPSPTSDDIADDPGPGSEDPSASADDSPAGTEPSGSSDRTPADAPSSTSTAPTSSRSGGGCNLAASPSSGGALVPLAGLLLLWAGRRRRRDGMSSQSPPGLSRAAK